MHGRVVGEERILESVPVEGAVSSQVLVMTADVTSSDLSIKVVQVHDEQHLHDNAICVRVRTTNLPAIHLGQLLTEHFI